MLYKDPVVLYLNITVCIILLLVVVPTLFNNKEKAGVKFTYGFIFFTVIITCINNLLVFYFENHRLLFLQFSMMSFPYFFGPCIYFYVRFINGDRPSKEIWFHAIPALIIFLSSIYFLFLDDDAKKVILQKILAGNYLYYNLVNLFTILIPITYCILAKRWLKKMHVDDGTTSIQLLKKKWANEFTNYFLYNMAAFTGIMIILNVGLKLPQVYTDLIAMPLFMLIVYVLINTRMNIISQETEILYLSAKAENEQNLNRQRLEISRDLHDNMGAHTISLLYKIDYLQTSKNMDDKAMMDLKESAENILSLLRQNIWVLNNEEISIEEYFSHFKNYTLKSFNHTAVKIYFVQDISVDKKIKAKTAANLLRILQEALQNAMKHSKTEKLEIGFYCNPELKISIRDFGIGCKPGHEKGYGLNNMESRAKEVGLFVKITSKVGEGTEVTVTEIPPKKIP